MQKTFATDLLLSSINTIDPTIVRSAFFFSTYLGSRFVAGVSFEPRSLTPQFFRQRLSLSRVLKYFLPFLTLEHKWRGLRYKPVRGFIAMMYLARHIFQSELLPALNAFCRLLGIAFANLVYQDCLAPLHTDTVAELGVGVPDPRGSLMRRNTSRQSLVSSLSRQRRLGSRMGSRQS